MAGSLPKVFEFFRGAGGSNLLYQTGITAALRLTTNPLIGFIGQQLPVAIRGKMVELFDKIESGGLSEALQDMVIDVCSIDIIILTYVEEGSVGML